MLKTPSIYPFTFVPILKEKVWGGEKLTHHFNKSGKKNTGESWEISGVAGDVSVVENGPLKGKSLIDLITLYGASLMGDKVFKTYGNTFPLLFKFIDAAQDLSVQLHPDDVLAKERHNSFGKTEMWYIMDAEKDARLILGFKEDVSKETYLDALKNNTIVSILKEEKVATGDVFFIPPGTVHAIGGGIVLAEIQQTSDVTYRIYDWDRPDVDGKYRQLHTKQALAAIDFKASQLQIQNTHQSNTVSQLYSVPYFETNILSLTEAFTRALQTIDSFVVYMCVEGEVAITTSIGNASLHKGQTVLLPAICTTVSFTTKNCTLLEVYIP